MLVVSMVWVPRVKEVELRVVDLVLFDPVLELLPVPRYEASSLVDDVSNLEQARILKE